MMRKLNINDRDAVAIKNNTKRVMIMTNKDYSILKVEDVIELYSDSLGILYVKVKEVNHYDSLEDLLELEGMRYTVSFTNKKDEAIEKMYQLDGFEDETKKNGVYAIHIEYLYSEDTVWEELYAKAQSVRNPRDVSGMISAGGVGAAILTKNHNIYTGVCIDTASTLGMCGERNAIANMLTNGESEIIKLVCVDSNGKVGAPCGACREYLMQLDKNSKNIEILKNEKNKEIITLEYLIPDWWGYDRV